MTTKESMTNPFLQEVVLDEQHMVESLPAYLILLALLLYSLVAIAFLFMAGHSPNIIVQLLFAIAAVVSFGAGIFIGISVWQPAKPFR